jgi:predicted phosphoribosyltransferase
LDLLLVRKIGAPHQPELAVGAVIDGGSPLIVRDRQLLALTGTRIKQFERTCTRELAEIERRRKLYLGGRAPLPVKGRIVIMDWQRAARCGLPSKRRGCGVQRAW